MIIEDGNGSSTQAKVSKNSRLYTFAVTESKGSSAVRDGRGYNINTGSIELTSANESAVLYVKNNENNDIVIDSVIVILGKSTGGSADDDVVCEIIRNPTTGTIISNATDVDVSSNANFGSNNLLVADSYKGAEGNTFTNGSNHILSLLQAGNRWFFNLDVLLPKGASLGVTLNPPASNTSMDVMVAVNCHVDDPDE